MVFVKALVGFLLVAGAPVAAEALNKSVCDGLQDEAQRRVCLEQLERYEQRKAEAEADRAAAQQEALMRQRAAQNALLKGFSVPRIEHYSGRRVRVVFDRVTKRVRVQCVAYDAQRNFVDKRTFLLTPPADDGVLYSRDAKRIKRVTCS